VEGRSFTCPSTTLPIGSIVAMIPSGEKVDPKKLYRFVIDEKGKTHTISYKWMKKLDSLTVHYIRKPLMTHNQEVLVQIAMAREVLQSFIENFENDNANESED